MLALLSVSPKKWPNTLKQLNCLSVFDDFVGLMLKGLTALKDLTIKIIFLLRLLCWYEVEFFDKITFRCLAPPAAVTDKIIPKEVITEVLF